MLNNIPVKNRNSFNDNQLKEVRNKIIELNNLTSRYLNETPAKIEYIANNKVEIISFYYNDYRYILYNEVDGRSWKYIKKVKGYFKYNDEKERYITFNTFNKNLNELIKWEKELIDFKIINNE